MLRLLLAPGLIALAVGACAYRQEKGGSLPSRNQGAIPAFAEVRDKVLGPQCLRCHQEFSDYGRVFAAREDIRQKVLVDHTMPKGGSLTPEQTDILTRWLDGGAPEQLSGPVQPTGTPQSPGAPQALAPTWDNVQSHFFKPYCLKCHSGDSPEGDLDLSDLAQVRKAASSILKHVFVLQDMPRSRKAYAAVTEEDKMLLVDWIEARMPGPDGSPAPLPSPAPHPSPSPAPQPSASPEPAPSSSP